MRKDKNYQEVCWEVLPRDVLKALLMMGGTAVGPFAGREDLGMVATAEQALMALQPRSAMQVVQVGA